MKTPEEMAEEYTRYWWPDYNDVKTCCQTHLATRQAFLAGYRAAQDRLLAQFKSLLSSFAETSFNPSHTAWQMFDILNDQVADVSKVMCNTTMEEIKAVDTGEITPITNLPTSAKWISVKDRLPEDKHSVIYWHDQFGANVGHYDSTYPKPNYHWWSYSFGDNADFRVKWWMPLPAPPQEEK